ncbi:DUF1579 domain-containing protein [Aestuariibacter halophilus]|uniref:DUF1579 domain-containing protein n=1 Tax=Fluctibacter halophilus TaxID=226011 RepID=A0ABS8G8R4_9ALTE|nr:DUF1579 family protein [Aestuariibacter halophilus]MCC2616556.1 DUF1579 domain-containing protein [Aestuariibacter halophilus]
MNDQTPAGMPITEEHRLLHRLAGEFSAEMEMFMGQEQPLRGQGTMHNRLLFDGRYLHQHFQASPMAPGQPAFNGEGYWGYNTVSKVFEIVWIDSVSTMLQVERGTFNDWCWDMRGELTDPHSGKPLFKRSLINVDNANEYQMTIQLARQPEQWQTSMEIRYTRI